jgi:hypothetical protein
MKYQVIVGNVGTVIDTDDVQAAHKSFKGYTKIVHERGSRATGEAVTLMRDGEEVCAYEPTDVEREDVETTACWLPGCYLAVDEKGVCEAHGAAPRDADDAGGNR